jgi:glycosyltransferase involved in cell wall biosynthesis
MRIAIDATPIGVKTTDKGGIYRYVWGLLSGLTKIDSSNEYVAFFNFFRRSHLPHFNKASSYLNNKGFNIRKASIPSRIWNLDIIPADIFTGRIDVYHGLFSVVPPLIKGKIVVTIHDLRSIYFKESFNQEWIDILKQKDNDIFFECLKDYECRINFFKEMRKRLKRSAKRSDLIITPSRFSKQNIAELLDVPEGKIRIIYHGISPILYKREDTNRKKEVLRKYRISRRFLLYVGKIDPLKNLLLLMDVFKRVRENLDVNLVMVGPKGWFYHVIKKRIDELDLGRYVMATDFISDEELSILYKEAAVFILPSLYEGFGIPVIEAMACGTPVVCSNVCCLPEVVQDAGILVDPHSIEGFVEAATQVIKDRQLRRRLTKRGLLRAKEFSWEKTASETLKVYKEAYQS